MHETGALVRDFGCPGFGIFVADADAVLTILGEFAAFFALTFSGASARNDGVFSFAAF